MITELSCCFTRWRDAFAWARGHPGVVGLESSSVVVCRAVYPFQVTSAFVCCSTFVSWAAGRGRRLEVVIKLLHRATIISAISSATGRYPLAKITGLGRPTGLRNQYEECGAVNTRFKDSPSIYPGNHVIVTATPNEAPLSRTESQFVVCPEPGMLATGCALPWTASVPVAAGYLLHRRIPKVVIFRVEMWFIVLPSREGQAPDRL